MKIIHQLGGNFKPNLDGKQLIGMKIKMAGFLSNNSFGWIQLESCNFFGVQQVCKF